MNNVVKGSFELMKQLNIVAILKVIKNNGSLSRADIAKLTRLTPASVTNITKSLIEEGYLIERGMGESSGGRPPIILELNINARFIIGVNIGVGVIEAVISNLGGELLVRKSISVMDEKLDVDYIFEKLINLINEVLVKANVEGNKILGLGVAMHGVVNAETGISEYAPYYQWEKVNIKEKLEETLGYEVRVDNDVRAMALAESWFGITKDVSNFITINVSNGIGAGIIIDNKPYYGVDFSAGEIGHIVVDAEGGMCNCGNYGCLETMASNESLIKKVKKKLKQGTNSILLNEKLQIENIAISDICSAAMNGDELAISVIKDGARYIGIGVSNLVNILNPKEIVLVGEIFEDTTCGVEVLQEVVKKRGLRLSTENIRIVKSSLGKDSAVMGAVTLVINELYNGTKFI